MPATLSAFDPKGWVRRFGQALEATAATARHMGVPIRIHGTLPIGARHRETHRRYLDMAALANTDPYAAKLFDESHLWLDALPDGVLDLLREHPVIEQAWSGGSRQGFHFVQVLGGGHADAKSLIAHLAKLSARVGGKYAATMLHRFFVAGDDARLHAHEIIVLHGLELNEPIPLRGGASLASYEATRHRFGLPEDPEPWLNRRDDGLDLYPGRLPHTSSCAVLIRPLSWGPAVAPCVCQTGARGPLLVKYGFPDGHRVESAADVFEGRDALLHLLSIAVRSKLVSHSEITVVPSWMKRIEPNLRTQPPSGQRGVFDVWPKDHAPSTQEIDAFVAAARGWASFCAAKEDRRIELAIRRTAAAYGIAGGRFGTEDRIIDASIALEAMYGPFGHAEITHKIALRAAWLLGDSAAQRRKVFNDMRKFYATRSKVAHGTAGKDRPKRDRELAAALASGRELARNTLFALLDRGPVEDESAWNALVLDDPIELRQSRSR